MYEYMCTRCENPFMWYKSSVFNQTVYNRFRLVAFETPYTKYTYYIIMLMVALYTSYVYIFFVYYEPIYLYLHIPLYNSKSLHLCAYSLFQNKWHSKSIFMKRIILCWCIKTIKVKISKLLDFIYLQQFTLYKIYNYIDKLFIKRKIRNFGY